MVLIDKNSGRSGHKFSCHVRLSLEIFPYVTQLNLIFKDIGMNHCHKLKCS